MKILTERSRVGRGIVTSEYNWKLIALVKFQVDIISLAHFHENARRHFYLERIYDAHRSE